MSHSQNKVGQAAQAQKEVFEVIQQSKSFFLFITAVESGVAFSQCGQTGQNNKRKELECRKI